ncbi:histidinol phosphate aminotransferase apoenzyme [Ruegeria halocynthiae]|uniref:Histidinol-phosphate aminotransferase n=1 Tax=Ruegeria halocynthiae TaxID=985054 RepID=A0A1H2VVN5_9RHOB|nr:histidinol-phosphate transaminase [Ruegeria halocynthiae]SDW72297.1 histidinol phosphate aminotransferase apoenzyme [Ruegeria halocynthiae]
MTQITPQPGIMDIALYQGGQSHVAGVADVIKLSSNENPFGPSPKAIEAVRDSAAALHRYPSTDHAGLRSAIAGRHDLDADRIICGVGSDEVLQFVAQAYAGPGDQVIYTEHGFSMYPIIARMAGATPVMVPERDRRVDVDIILAAVTEQTKIVFVTNPGNPTSTMISEGELERLAQGLPGDCLLVLDGAYAEFVEGFDGGAGLVDRFSNVIMTRTFSKVFGLGGMRVGWGYAASEIIDVLNRVRQPFNLSSTALTAAEAAIQDEEYLRFCQSENARLRTWLSEELAKVGVASDASCTNFILARFADQTEAEACDDYLKTQGLIVRKVAGYNLPNALRITVGDEEACRRVVAAITAFKGGNT